MKQPKARIIGMGSYVPKKILTNQDFEKMVDTTDEWIVSRTGIKERRVAEAGELTSHMGTKAAQKALAAAGLTVADVDLIIVATMSPDYMSNSTAALIQSQLGAPNVGAFDIQAACSGYIYALSVAKAFVEAGMYERVLLVASERMSTYVDYADRGTCVIFGDGASASIISRAGQGLAIDGVVLGSDGSAAELVYVPAGGVKEPPTQESVAANHHVFKMQGQEVFKLAVRAMVASAKESLNAVQLAPGQLKWVVPHQANLRIMDAVMKGFNLPTEKMVNTIYKYGNTSASSIPLALEEVFSANQMSTGDSALLVAFGAGLTWGSCVLTKVDEETW